MNDLDGPMTKDETKRGCAMLCSVLILCIFAPIARWIFDSGHPGISHCLTFVYAFASGSCWMYGMSNSRKSGKEDR